MCVCINGTQVGRNIIDFVTHYICIDMNICETQMTNKSHQTENIEFSEFLNDKAMYLMIYQHVHIYFIHIHITHLKGQITLHNMVHLSPSALHKST